MAGREVFVDTSALYALIDRNDSRHSAARDVVAALINARRHLVTTDYVVTETVNLANARRGALVGLRILDLFEQSAGIRMEWIGPDRFAATKAFFRKYSDQGFSFTDCSSFTIMRELRVTAALTTDRHFKAAGFQVLMTLS